MGDTGYNDEKYDRDPLEKRHRTVGQRAVKLMKKRIPITRWLPRYQKSDIIGDAVAGITVGMTVVPQSIAYVSIAGLSPEYGLYSSYMGVFIYAFLGSCRQASAAVGPTVVMSLLTYQTCGDNYAACAVLTAFYAGVFQILMAILQLGWLVSFISEPVTVGFTAGAATTIASSQLGSLFGLSGEKGDDFITYWKAIVNNFTTIQTGDTVLGICSIIVLVSLRRLKDVKVQNKHLATFIWLLSLSRNAMVILLTSLMAFIWKDPPFKVVGTVHGGFPSVGPPEFLLSHRPVMDNGTLVPSDDKYSFGDTWSILQAGPVLIALLSTLQNVAISKAFGAGQAVDATQEMLALGVGSVVGSFFSSISIASAFSRSAVCDASGVRTPLAGTFTGILVILALNFLTSSFYWIPKASLAAMVISAVIIMIEYERILPMWRISKIDCVSCLITYIAAIGLGMEYGILVGVGITVGVLLLKSLRPQLKLLLKYDSKTSTEYVLMTPENGLNFPSVDHITTTIQKLTLKCKECCFIIIDFTKWTEMDYTGANTFALISKGLKRNGKTLAFMNCGETWINAFKIAGMSDPPLICGKHNISLFIQDNMATKPNHEISKTIPSLDAVMVESGLEDISGVGKDDAGLTFRGSWSGSTGSVASRTKPIS